MTESNSKIKKKIIKVFAVIIAILFILTLWVARIMLIKGDQYKKEALEQQTRDRLITPKRGTVYDRNGKPLAVSASVETVSISPKSVRDGEKVDETAELLSEVLGLDKKAVLEKINKNTSYEVIMKKVEKEQADKIRAKKLPGVNLDEDSKRYYPYGNFASHLIGFTGDENYGLQGIEMIYDSYLRGNPGRIVSANSADGKELPYKYERFYTSENGTNVVLTIDQTVQHFLEKHMETAVIDNKLQKGAAGLIMNVKTGEILAMATKPDFDLNDPFKLSASDKDEIRAQKTAEEKSAKESELLLKKWRNKAVEDSYEPGSTFKIIVAAMGLETGKLKVDDQFYCNGYKEIGGFRIHCWKTTGHGAENFVDGIKNSCNPVFMEIGDRIGNKDFYKYYKAFGFTETTNIELNGETSGIFYGANMFNETELATSSFGQGFQVTPLQMLTAVSAVANGGYLMRPYLVKQLSNDDGEIIKETKPQIVRQVISSETSKILCQLLENVVTDGTGKNAFIKGFHIAGKTATSEKQPRGSDKYIASFVGFAPANDPQVACLIILDEPLEEHMGGVIAAPVVKKVMEDTLVYLGVEPDLSESEANIEATVPSVIGMSIEDAREALNYAGLDCKVEGEGSIVLRQIPEGMSKVADSATVIVYTEEESAE